MRRTLLAAALAAISSSAVRAETIPAPPLMPGDSWTYANGHTIHNIDHTTHDTITLLRADQRMIGVEVHTAGMTTPGPERLLGPDWSRVRSVNGRPTVVNRPLAFPLTSGKSWTVQYSETNPSNRAHVREDWHITMHVAGWEDVTEPAGTFHALKIEGEGEWTAILPPNRLTTSVQTPNGGRFSVSNAQGARVASGRYFKTFWYVPEVRRWVKSREEYFSADGIQNELNTSDLESFSVVPATAASNDPPPAAAPVTKPRKVRHHPPAASRPTPAPPPPGLEETELRVVHRAAAA